MILNESTHSFYPDSDPKQEKEKQFLMDDIYTHPQFRENQTLAVQMQRVRLDSSGYPLRRTIMGEDTEYDFVKNRRYMHSLVKQQIFDSFPN